METNIHTLFAGQRNYRGLENPSVLYTMGIFNDDICPNSQCDNPTNLFGGRIVVNTTEEDDYQSFVIAYYNLPQSACAKIAATNWGDSSSGFLGLVINRKDEIDSPVSEQQARSVCNLTENVVVWVYR